MPRTWEDPDVVHPDAQASGDNDPLDVCEIGLRILGVGEIVPVKVLGCLCLIDEGEADWKVIAIAVSDPWAPLLNDVGDVEEKLPGIIGAIREWFRTYKIPDGALCGIRSMKIFASVSICFTSLITLRFIDQKLKLMYRYPQPLLCR